MKKMFFTFLIIGSPLSTLNARAEDSIVCDKGPSLVVKQDEHPGRYLVDAKGSHREGLSSFKAEFVVQSLERSPHAASKIAELLALKDTQDAEGSYVASAGLSYLVRYRLSHMMNVNQSLPENIYYTGDGVEISWENRTNLFESVDYMGTIDDMGFREFNAYFDSLKDVMNWLKPDLNNLNSLDQSNDYSILRAADYQKIKSKNPDFFKRSDTFCLLGDETPSPQSHYIHVNGSLLSLNEDELGACFDEQVSLASNKFLIVRKANVPTVALADDAEKDVNGYGDCYYQNHCRGSANYKHIRAKQCMSHIAAESWYSYNRKRCYQRRQLE